MSCTIVVVTWTVICAIPLIQRHENEPNTVLLECVNFIRLETTYQSLNYIEEYASIAEDVIDVYRTIWSLLKVGNAAALVKQTAKGSWD